MTNYGIHIEIPAGRVKEILDKLQDAQETIYKCYTELQDLGVLTVRKDTSSGD